MIELKTTLIAIATALALLCLGNTAHAEGTVIKIDGRDIYIDLGARDGVGSNTKLTLLHVIVAKNPVTGKKLRDRFPLGQLTVIKSGDHISIASAPASIRHRVRVGDEVTLASRKRIFEDPWKKTIASRKVERVERAKPPPRRDPVKEELARRAARHKQAQASIDHAEKVKATWERTLGKAPLERIAIWEVFLKTNPGSPHAPAIRQEIQSLRQQRQAEERAAQQIVDPKGRRAELRAEQLAVLEPEIEGNELMEVNAPGRAYEGSPVPLSFTVLDPDEAQRGWLYYRQQGADSFRRVQLGHDGDAYMRGEIPGDAVKPPGIDYFVEVARTDGDSPPISAVGNQEVPHRIPVQATVEEKAPDIDDRSRVTLFLDFVDFDGKLAGGYDQYVLAEIDFMYRFFKPIYAVRVGFGTLGGKGGDTGVIDSTDDCGEGTNNFRCRQVALSYAFTEFEIRFSHSIALMLRPQFNNGTVDFASGDPAIGRCSEAGRDDPLCKNFSGLSLNARIRIGPERDTNLALGMSLNPNVGNLFEAAFTWGVIPKFPVKLAAQVTNQPDPELSDYGVRIIGDVGWRSVGWVYPSLRLAFQARNVNHAGISGGIAANFDW